jgi:transglutaminase-like putative cysteine protease
LKTVNFQYQTKLAFSSPASDHRFLLRILPQSDERQRIKNISWHISPQAVVWNSSDGFGNEALSGCIEAPHNHFSFGINGTAEISSEPYTMRGKPECILSYPTELTKPQANLIDFYKSLECTAEKSTLQRVQFFGSAVHQHLHYERGITTNATTAAEAFNIGTGVCQDYAHILLTLLRLDGTPCRYVMGLASDYGETHAWVEAWIADRYYGIDPTRNKLIDEGYLALSHGRDFEDASVERGIFKGSCRGIQTIILNMEIEQ